MDLTSPMRFALAVEANSDSVNFAGLKQASNDGTAGATPESLVPDTTSSNALHSQNN